MFSRFLERYGFKPSDTIPATAAEAQRAQAFRLPWDDRGRRLVTIAILNASEIPSALR